MSIDYQTGTTTQERKILTVSSPQEVGESFLAALTARDFEALEQIFMPKASFRSLVPSTERFGSTASAAVGHLRNWFGDKDTIEVIQSTTEMIDDVLSLQYRLRTHNRLDGWQVIEQHAYCEIQDGKIHKMRLVCSGFHPDPDQSTDFRLGGTLFYDAGAKSCAEGPLEEIARLMRPLASGQTLEIHATHPSVAGDLPAWCRLTGHELISQELDHYLIRHK